MTAQPILCTPDLAAGPGRVTGLPTHSANLTPRSAGRRCPHSPGDGVRAFDRATGFGCGTARLRQGKRLGRTATTEGVRVRSLDEGVGRGLAPTPGHQGLEASGHFPTIQALTREGRATVVLAAGATGLGNLGGLV